MMTLRDPPLKLGAVIDHLCEAIHQMSLPASQERLTVVSTYGITAYKKSHQGLLHSAVVKILLIQHSHCPRQEMRDGDEKLGSQIAGCSGTILGRP